MNNEIAFYDMEVEDFDKLKLVSARLNDPKALSWDDRRDLANLIDLIRSRAIPVYGDLSL